MIIKFAQSLHTFAQAPRFSNVSTFREVPKRGSFPLFVLLLGRFERNAVIERFEPACSFLGLVAGSRLSRLT